IADHRQHEAFSAHIHGAGDVMVFARGYTHDGGKVGRLEIAQRALHRLEAEARMLEIEESEIAARRFHDVANTGGGEFNNEMPEFRGFGLGHGLEAGHAHTIPPTSFFGAWPLRIMRYSFDPSKTRSAAITVFFVTKWLLAASKAARCGVLRCSSNAARS